MGESAPQITVVIPTCHRNEALRQCLERLAPGAQTLAPGRYEVVVTDDGSRETAEEMVRQRFPWARWSAGPRRGPASNRNAGAQQARGEWLAFTDDDCLPAREWLAAFADAVRPEGDFYEGRTVCSVGLASPLLGAPVNLKGGAFWSCNILIRRARFQALGGFDEAFPFPHMEDVDLRERILGAGEHIPFVADAVVDHPPRPVTRGRRRALHQESEFLFYYKSGHHGRFSPILLRKLVLGTLQGLRSFRFQPDTIKSLLWLAQETAIVAARAPAWERKYAQLYGKTDIPYPADMDQRLFYRRSGLRRGE